MVLAVLLVVSCQRGYVARSAADSQEKLGGMTHDSAELAYRLSQTTWCSNNEACSMVLFLVDGKDDCQTFDQRLVALDVKGLVDASWDLAADQTVAKGTLAYMLYHALDMNGGLMMHLLPSRRYAYREVVNLGLMTMGSEYEPLTGPEVVGIMGRAARMKKM